MPSMMESFVQRFNILEAQRETGNELIKVRFFDVDAMVGCLGRIDYADFNSHQDLLIYIETVENNLRHENDRLTKELNDAHLDLDDSRKSRRELQIHWNLTTQHLERAITENGILQVGRNWLGGCIHH